MTRGDVQNYIFECLDNLLENHNIKYIKWDMNRPFSQVGAENLENAKMYSYLHTMAVYKIVDELKSVIPKCSLKAVHQAAAGVTSVQSAIMTKYGRVIIPTLLTE